MNTQAQDVLFCVADISQVLPGELSDDQDYMYDHGEVPSSAEGGEEGNLPDNDPAYAAWVDERMKETAEYLSDPKHEADFEQAFGYCM